MPVQVGGIAGFLRQKRAPLAIHSGPEL